MVVVVDPISQPRFFVGAVMGPASWPRFFIGACVSLAIGRAVLTGREVAVGFFGIFLW